MEITDKLIDEMPGVQENAIDQLQNEQESKLSKLRDRMGRAFTKEYHSTDDTGKPLLTKKGELRVVRGPKKKPPLVSTIGGLETPGPLGLADGQDHIDAEIIATGQSAASLTFVIGMAVFGTDGQPTQAEINQVTMAYQTYFRAKNIRDLPPGIVLVTALASYTVPRLMKPKQVKRFSSLWDKVKVKFGRKRGEKGSERQTESITDKDI